METDFIAPQDHILWGDIETTGLSPIDEVPLEIGFILTDKWGNEIAEWHSLVGHPLWRFHIERADDVVVTMHTKSHLIRDIRQAADKIGTGFYRSHHPEQLTGHIIEWLHKHRIELKKHPLAGSSIHFDREWLKEHFKPVNTFLSYRNIDISSIKELCSRLNPTLYSKLPAKRLPDHRVMNDIRNSIDEYKWYLDNFLWVEE